MVEGTIWIVSQRLTGQNSNPTGMWHFKEQLFHVNRNQINRNKELLYQACFHSLLFLFLKHLKCPNSGVPSIGDIQNRSLYNIPPTYDKSPATIVQ